jgi:hypothetical protein
MNWLSPPDRRLARVCMGAVPIAPFRPRADTDRQRCVSTAPAAALTRATCLPASTSHACSRHLTPTVPTDRHVRSTHDACSRCPVRHPIALSAPGRRRLSSSRDTCRMMPTLLSPHSSAPSTEAPTTPHRSHAPLRHAKPAAEPLFAASNR